MIPSVCFSDFRQTDPCMEAFHSLNKNPRRPLGKFSPWAWCIEPVRGCNLRCWHCPVSVTPLLQGAYQFMDLSTWENTFRLISQITPYCRVEMAHSGEPTLHPNLCQLIQMARQISPHSQLQITTNGTTLLSGDITYNQLFQAGLNVVYVDMYGQYNQHKALVQQAGIPYSIYYDSLPTDLSPWTYHNNPGIQFVVLAEPPSTWPSKKYNRGALGTFLNHINFDSETAKSRGVIPVVNAPLRRCNQPMKYIQVSVNGTYFFCCQDAFNEASISQNVNNGISDFLAFWFGEYMQRTRQILSTKHRDQHPLCQKCSIIFSRCDMKLWTKDMFTIRYLYDSQGGQRT